MKSVAQGNNAQYGDCAVTIATERVLVGGYYDKKKQDNFYRS